MSPKPPSISSDTVLFMEARAICLMNEGGRESFSQPSPALIKTIAERLTDYATVIELYGNPPAMSAAWDRIANDTGNSMGQINMDMLDIATVYRSAIAYGKQANGQLIDRIQQSRIMLRSQAFRPARERMNSAAAHAVSRDGFKKGSLTLVL